MTPVEQLQQIGLNKYEAEAYYTLLSEGALTGYELGKRSQVPLSRSYEILERLTQKGLALVQPGDPPRYSAENPNQFLGQVRQTITTTLNALATSLASLSHPETANEFWILRSRQHILARARVMIEGTQEELRLYLPPSYNPELADVLVDTQKRNCRVFRSATLPPDSAGSEIILLLVDGREALVGTLTPLDRCQAVVSANSALITALSTYFMQQVPVENTVPVTSTASSQRDEPLSWIAWEDRKQRRLWSPNTGNRVA